MMPYDTGMKRVQVQLTDKQESTVRRYAARSGRSVAAVIREAVDRFVAEDVREDRIKRVMALAGKYRDREGATDVARNHDRYLVEAFRK